MFEKGRKEFQRGPNGKKRTSDTGQGSPRIVRSLRPGELVREVAELRLEVQNMGLYQEERSGARVRKPACSSREANQTGGIETSVVCLGAPAIQVRIDEDQNVGAPGR